MRETVTARCTLKIGASANDTWRAVAATGREIRAQRGNMTRRARKSGAYMPGTRRRCGRWPAGRVRHSVATWHVVYANPALIRWTCVGAATGDRPRWFRYSMATRHARARKSGAYPLDTRRRCNRRPAEMVQVQRGNPTSSCTQIRRLSTGHAPVLRAATGRESRAQRGNLTRSCTQIRRLSPGTCRRCGGTMSGTKDLLHDKTHNDGGGVRRACAAQYFRR